MSPSIYAAVLDRHAVEAAGGDGGDPATQRADRHRCEEIGRRADADLTEIVNAPSVYDVPARTRGGEGKGEENQQEAF